MARFMYFNDLLAKWFAIDSVPVTTFNGRFRRRVMAASLASQILPVGPYIAIGHGCSELGRERMLTPEEWKRLLWPLILAGHDMVFIGGSGDSGRPTRSSGQWAPDRISVVNSGSCSPRR